MRTTASGHQEEASAPQPNHGTEAEARLPEPRMYTMLDPAVTRHIEFSKTLQKWRGTVVDVLEQTFRASLDPLKGEGGEQLAEIYLDEVDAEDKQLLRPGAVFYWSIGYLNRMSGRKRESSIRFRRLPPYSESEIAKADQEADRLAAFLRSVDGD